jgi:DNA sulfur modification protein DndE
MAVKAPPMERVLANRTMLIDVHAMPVLKELVAYLVIERLYKEMATLPDSPVTEGRRTIRTILVIDEAHNYLSQKNMFLQRIIREGRSKGVVVFFASQSPNDYQQKFFNFQQLLEFAYIFQCNGVAACVGSGHSGLQRQDGEGLADRDCATGTMAGHRAQSGEDRGVREVHG